MNAYEYITTQNIENISTSLIAKKNIPSNTNICHYGGCPRCKIISEASMHSVQLSATRHAECPEIGRFCAHSNNPNCILVPFIGEDWKTASEAPKDVSSDVISGFWLRTIKEVELGDILSFNYNTSEWHLHDPFVDSITGELVSGFSVLPMSFRMKIKDQLTPYIREQSLTNKLVDIGSPILTKTTQANSVTKTRGEQDSTSSAGHASMTALPSPILPSGSFPLFDNFLKLNLDDSNTSILESIKNVTQVVDSKTIGKYLIATVDLDIHTPVGIFTGDSVLDKPNMHTVQLDENKHLNSFTDARFAAHSSLPNCKLVPFVDSNNLEQQFYQWKLNSTVYDNITMDYPAVGYFIVTIKKIKKSESINWNYNSSEWDVTSSFVDENTGQQIFGFGNLSNDEKNNISHLITPFIFNKWSLMK